MKKYWILKGIKIAFFATILFGAFTFGFMHLWNWLMPEIFNLPSVNIWQAIGLLVMSKLIFGGFGRGHNGWRNHKSGWKRKWESMSDEEKLKVKSHFKRHCSKWTPDDEPITEEK